MCATKYIHSASVIHRDLKPSNILLNADCSLRVCDFGLARGVSEVLSEAGELTEYVVTVRAAGRGVGLGVGFARPFLPLTPPPPPPPPQRWYRAPEVMLATQEYSQAIDVWSIGCIFAEVLGSKPLFPGDDYIHQLKLITDVLGSPAERDMTFITSARARTFMAKQAGKPKKPWAQIFPKASPVCLDLLDRMLAFHPGLRITAKEALEHPYFASLHSEEPADEPVAHSPADFSFETAYGALDKGKLQRLMFKQISDFHPSALAAEVAKGTWVAGAPLGLPALAAGGAGMTMG